ncbi:hypothetical protein SAMN06273572_103199 [Monaibacterium marinum]|uniref:Methyltransferase domain-containing protein n=1 Tax=Pontivivens marinum TaxID=1690039 RepID=A0A2C9CSJ6_9RHOB|nr:hypothetical protein [Monaibacterium marinum]SOH94170.1 hypothetical protein SAMN06273572_103199 [Monaibacterium marinum]
MAFFDFLNGIGNYNNYTTGRLNQRHRFVVAPFVQDITGARVLDLASQFAQYPQTDAKDRVTLIHDDIYSDLEQRGTRGETFDIVSMLGILYHVMDHYGFLVRVARLNPRLIIIDSEFITSKSPSIRLIRERTDNVLNATADLPGQAVTIKGIPSTSGMEAMADVLGYRCEWMDWSTLPEQDRVGLRDYFRDKPRCRGTCIWRKVEATE